MAKKQPKVNQKAWDKALGIVHHRELIKIIERGIEELCQDKGVPIPNLLEELSASLIRSRTTPNVCVMT